MAKRMHLVIAGLPDAVKRDLTELIQTGYGNAWARALLMLNDLLLSKDDQYERQSTLLGDVKAELAKVRQERDAAVVDAERYLHSFAHRHQTWLTGGDDCKKCGLDLRDPIHSQAAIDAALAARKEGNK